MKNYEKYSQIFTFFYSLNKENEKLINKIHQLALKNF